MEEHNTILDKYFQAAKSQELVVSLQEARQNFVDNLPKSPPANGTASSSFLSRFFKFFGVKINVIYTIISTLLVGLLLWGYWSEDGQQPYRVAETTASQVGSPIEEEVVAEGNEKENTNRKKGRGTAGMEQPSSKPVVEQKPSVVEEKNEPEEAVSVPEKRMLGLDTLSLSGKSITNETHAVTKKSEAKSHAKQQSSSVEKPPFRYTFTPETQERELRQLQQDLKRENVVLVFSKLKYKGNLIEKIEGSITLEGYEGTFTTDEFDDFTFTWSYSKTNGGLPEKFDIIINTPMKKKSNTAVNIDEITY